jgi:hypothetical protein
MGAIMTDVPDYLKNMARIRLTSPNGEVETVSAIVMGDYFRVQGFPKYATDVSRGDVVEATEIEIQDLSGLTMMAGAAGIFEFVRVVIPSGNRMLRIIFDDIQDFESIKDLTDRLGTRGYDCEGTEHRLVISIRPELNIDEVAAYFDACGFRWEYANPSDSVP